MLLPMMIREVACGLYSPLKASRRDIAGGWEMVAWLMKGLADCRRGPKRIAVPGLPLHQVYHSGQSGSFEKLQLLTLPYFCPMGGVLCNFMIFHDFMAPGSTITCT